MAGIIDRFDASNPITNDTVTATVTRTITTTNTGGQDTTVYSSTDVKSITVDREPGLIKDTSFAETPVSVTHVENAKRTTAKYPGLNGDTLELGSGETTADFAVQQLLSSMLRSGLKSKGANNNDPMKPKPSTTQGNK